MPESVPGGKWASGEEALADLLIGATKVQAAVAFVTTGGVKALAGLIDGLSGPPPHFEITARGAPVTDPKALINLRDQHGFRVSVVGAPNAVHYHPKLWLIETETEMCVLSGSGNLTAGGLNGNSEQFEAWTVDEEGAQEQRDRFKKLTVGSLPLDHFEQTPQWSAWIAQQKKRSDLEVELDRQLVVIGVAEEALKADLSELYDDMGAAKMTEEDGSTYFPHGFRLVLQGHRGKAKTPVAVIESLCHETTKGFERARRNNKLHLAAEVLAVDPAKSYHDLISPEVRAAAEQRLREAEAEGCAPSGV